MKRKKYLLIGGTILLFIIVILVLMSHYIYKEELIEVDANPEQGYNYGYYLYIPSGVNQSEIRYLLVEPNNTPGASDESTVHKKHAKKTVRYGIGNYISKELKIPLLVPTFDRPKSNVKMYTHSLDSDTLKNTEGKLARIDLQLINMIEDAKSRLLERNIELEDKVFLTGFSASGSFTNRFTALHPQIVKAVASGGVNCMPIIPTGDWEGKNLPFHIGVGNLKEIAGIEFDLDEYKKVTQYIYMGEQDENDTLPYSDAFNPEERKIVKEVLGQEMKERWEKSKMIYDYLNIPAQMVIYKGIGHTITPKIKKDLVEFFKLNSGDDTWIRDLGYEDSQIYRLTFNWTGDRSCPEIPIKINNDTYKLGFDTGCGVGIFLTNVMENDIDYTLLGKAEALNRDGSHRGWNKGVLIDELTVFGDTYQNIKTTISDWTMYSSEEFKGAIGLEYFKSKIITLDYTGHRIAVSNNPIDYDNLNTDKYVVLPLYQTTTSRQRHLPFFKAKYNGELVMVYLDTGKNYSYVYTPDSRYSRADKPRKFVDVPIKIANIEIMLSDVVEINNIAQAGGLPFPTKIELNSDQLWKCNLLVTFDLIDNNIIFSRLPGS